MPHGLTNTEEKHPVNIGIFGGTFNPPHIGHLIVAEHVRETLSLDRIMFVPAAIPPHKAEQYIVPPEYRMAMLRLATEDNPNFMVSDIEIERGGISFMIDTLTELKHRHPTDNFCLLIGMDNLLEFHAWRSPEKILTLASVVVMSRPGYEASDVPFATKDKVTICPVPEIDIASRDIRNRVGEGKSIQYLVSDSVRNYINAHQLYLPHTLPK